MPKQKNTIRCYDAGPALADRYTVVYLYDKGRDGSYAYVGMSADPTHPQGYGCHGEGASLGRHLGKRIRFVDLPLKCQKLVGRDLDSAGQVLCEGD